MGVRVKASGEQSVPGWQQAGRMGGGGPQQAGRGCGRAVHNLITSHPPLLRQERHAVDRGTPSQALFDTGL